MRQWTIAGGALAVPERVTAADTAMWSIFWVDAPVNVAREVRYQLMRLQPDFSESDQRVVVDTRGDDEWIAGLAKGARSLHIYRLGAGEWLVSEVGRDNEGRGSNLTQALAALSAGTASPEWWLTVADLVGASVSRR